MSTYIHAVDLEHQPFWMESFWSPDSVDWLNLRTFLCGPKLTLSTNGDLCFPSPSLGWPAQIQIADHPTARHSPGHSRLDSDLAFRKVVGAPSASGQRWILDFNSLLAFTSSTLVFAVVLWLVPANVNHGGNRAMALWRSLFSHSCSSCNGDQPGTCGPFHSPGTMRSCPPPPFPCHWRVANRTDVSNVSCT